MAVLGWVPPNPSRSLLLFRTAFLSAWRIQMFSTALMLTVEVGKSRAKKGWTLNVKENNLTQFHV